jgi:hypothetical protein
VTLDPLYRERDDRRRHAEMEGRREGTDGLLPRNEGFLRLRPQALQQLEAALGHF